MGTLTFKEGIKEIPTHKIIAAVGDEPFLRDQIKSRVFSLNKDLETIKIDCDETEDSLVLDMLRSQDLFSGKRIYVLLNFTKIKKLNTLVEEKFPNIIILDAEKASKSKQYEELKKKIPIIDCNKPKPWEEEADALGKILGYFKVRGYSISENNASLLYNRIGYNLYRIVSEMNKLILFKENSGNKEISEDDIEAVCVSGVNFSIFDIIDKIISGKKKEALYLLNEALKKDPNSSILFLSLWYTHLENLLFLKTTSKREDTLTQFIRMPPTIISKKLKPQTYKISVKTLTDSMNYLLDADKKLRQGFFDTRFYLEKFIITFPSETLI